MLLSGLTRSELIGNAMLMIGAGFDSTANALTFLSFNLAFHPNIQAKLQDEIDAAYISKVEYQLSFSSF